MRIEYSRDRNQFYLMEGNYCHALLTLQETIGILGVYATDALLAGLDVGEVQ